MLNEFQIIGNLGQDPNFFETANGNGASISVATTKSWKDKDGEWQERTTWHRVTFFHKPEILERFSKGDMVMVKGEVEYQLLEANDKKYQLANLRGFSIKKLKGSGENTEKKSQPSKKGKVAPAPAPASDDDLPF